ncbi:MAG: hypothetical protein ACM30I_02615 [Gemmatimonas sp.]
MRTLQGLLRKARRAREMAADSISDPTTARALIAYALEVEQEVRERLSARHAEHADHGGGNVEPSYWLRESERLRIEALAEMDENRRLLQILADECARLATLTTPRR